MQALQQVRTSTTELELFFFLEIEIFVGFFLEARADG
jgi:hypothetical protein